MSHVGFLLLQIFSSNGILYGFFLLLYLDYYVLWLNYSSSWWINLVCEVDHEIYPIPLTLDYELVMNRCVVIQLTLFLC